MEGNTGASWDEGRWSTASRRQHPAPPGQPILAPICSHHTMPHTRHVSPKHSLLLSLKASRLCLPKTPALWTHKAHHPGLQRTCLSPILSGVVFNEVYAASKFALEGFFESLAVQLLQFNIL